MPDNNPRPYTSTEKLGRISNHPSKSKFVGARRDPGWLPDTYQDSTTKGRQLFIEEAIRFENTNQTIPFGLVAGSLLKDYDLRTNILGVDLENPKNDFDTFLLSIISGVRKYNNALYYMRRLHFHENAAGASNANQYPPNENNNEPTHLPDKGTDELKNMIDAAQNHWDDAVVELRNLLEKSVDPNGFKHAFNSTFADMIEVNGFVVSMRIVSTPNSQPLPTIEEVGGSSSSHIRISSAFGKP